MTQEHGALADKGSLEDQAANDPELQEKIRSGRNEADADLSSMEHWNASGTTSRGGES